MSTQPSLEQLRTQPHWSISALQLFLSCPLKWAARYVLDAEPEFTPHALLFGRWFHNAILGVLVDDLDPADLSWRRTRLVRAQQPATKGTT